MSTNDSATPKKRATHPQPQHPAPTSDIAKADTFTTPTSTIVQRARQTPHNLSPRDIQRLQKTIGNRAVTQLLHASSAKGADQPPAQPDHTHAAVQSTMEQQIGADFSSVTLHTESSAAQAMDALAYTQGETIHFAPRQFQPQTPKGRALIGHELAHVVQQRQGRVEATRQAKGQPLNDDPALEQAADEVGQRVAAPPASGAEPPPTRQPWRIVSHGGGGANTPVQRKGAKETAKSRSITLDIRSVMTSKGMGSGLVMDPEKNKGKSMAADPAYEQEAETFEQRLGVAAFNDPRAMAAVVAICNKIEAYLEAKMETMWAKAKGLGEVIEGANAIYKKLAGDKEAFKYFAGTVAHPLKAGTDQEIADNLDLLQSAVDGVLNQGNVRERLNLIDRFMEDILNPDFKSAKDPTEWVEFQKIITAARLNVEAFEQQNVTPERELFDQNVGVEVKNPKERPVHEARDQIRIPSNKPADKTFTELTARDLRETPLSEREKGYQKSVSPEYAKGFNTPLKFTEGARYFLLNEESAWVQKMRALSVPLKGGPSGHTAIFFEANTLLGANADPHALRLAAIGHLLPIRAHSLIEIVEVAARYGCDPALFPGFYQGIKPYNQSELRKIAGGRFPGESLKDAYLTEKAEKLLEVDPEVETSTSVEESGSSPSSKEEAPPMPPEIRKRREELESVKSQGIVSKVLASKQRDEMEETLSQPHLTSNARDALKLAETLAASKREEDRAAVEERLKKEGIDLSTNPTAYDDCVEFLRTKGLTMNFGTHLMEVLFKNPTYKNIWTLPFTMSDPKYVAGRDLTERTLHDLPAFDPDSGEGTHRRAKTEIARDLIHKPGGLDSMKTQDEDATSGKKLKKHLPEPVEREKTKEDDETWEEWYYRTREDKTLTGELVDRPISSALNFTDYRGGGAAPYGSTHLKLKDSVKSRVTMTGQDSKDLIYQKGLGPEAVGTFSEMGPVLRYMEPLAFKRLVQLAVLKQPSESLSGEFGYIEAQIFGGVDLTRDIEKIVIDLDDLDLWTQGNLLIDPTVGRGYRPAKDIGPIKQALEAFAVKHQIPLQYVRSGKNSSSEETLSNKPLHKFSQTTAWEKDIEAALRAFDAKAWQVGLGIAQGIAPGVKKEFSFGGLFGPSTKTMGLDPIVAVTGEITKLQKEVVKGKMTSEARVFSTGLLSTLAGRLLEAYYHFPPKETHRDELERLLRDAIQELATCATSLVFVPQTENKLESMGKEGKGMDKLWRTATPEQRKQLLEITSLASDERQMSDLGYLLEALDPEHRRGFQPLAQQWLMDSSDIPFFEWLNKDKRRSGTASTLHSVTYFDNTQREDARLEVRGGKIAKAKSESPALVDDNIFVMDQQNVLYGGEKKAGKIQHSTFLAGMPARSAGHLIISSDGTLTTLTNESGHYRPGKREMEAVVAVLLQQKVPMETVKVLVDNKPVPLDLEQLQPRAPTETPKKVATRPKTDKSDTTSGKTSDTPELEKMIVSNSDPERGGITNAGNTCYIAAVLQLMAAVPTYHSIFTTPLPPHSTDAITTLHTRGAGIVAKINGQQDVNLLEMDQFRTSLFANGWLGGDLSQRVREQDASELFTFLMDLFASPTMVQQSHEWRVEGSRQSQQKVETNRMLTLSGLRGAGRGRTLESLLQENLNVVTTEQERGKPDTHHLRRLHALPPTLTIELSRYAYNQWVGQLLKLSERITIGQNLTIPATLSPDNADHLYELSGFIVHHGALPTTGHYTSYVKDGGQWYFCNDSSVTEVSEDKVNIASQTGTVFSFRQIN